jgi:hypothetical protein
MRAIEDLNFSEVNVISDFVLNEDPYNLTFIELKYKCLNALWLISDAETFSEQHSRILLETFGLQVAHFDFLILAGRSHEALAHVWHAMKENPIPEAMIYFKKTLTLLRRNNPNISAALNDFDTDADIDPIGNIIFDFSEKSAEVKRLRRNIDSNLAEKNASRPLIGYYKNDVQKNYIFETKKLHTKSSSFDLKLQEKWTSDCSLLEISEDYKRVHEIIHRFYHRRLSSFPDLINCQNFNDKIQWLKIFDSSDLKSRCADKIEVKNFFNNKLGASLYPETLRIWEDANEIDCSGFPNSFVLKANHDSGSVFIINKNEPNAQKIFENAISTLSKSIRAPYGIEKGEFCYSSIKRKIFAEEFIGAGVRPRDFKFHCINGITGWVQVFEGRGNDLLETTVDRDGKFLGIKLNPSARLKATTFLPANFYIANEYVEALSKGFKYVRVDSYLDNEIMFGEMTFYPYSGAERLTAGSWFFGSLMNFDRTSFFPPARV